MSQPLPCCCLHLRMQLTKLLEISTKNTLNYQEEQACCRMISEFSLYGNGLLKAYTYFPWQMKWRLEHLGALGIMGETAPIIPGVACMSRHVCVTPLVWSIVTQIPYLVKAYDCGHASVHVRKIWYPNIWQYSLFKILNSRTFQGLMKKFKDYIFQGFF